MKKKNKKLNKDKIEYEVLEPILEDRDKSAVSTEPEVDYIDLEALNEVTQVDIIQNLLPAVAKSKELTTTGDTSSSSPDPLKQYIKEISRYKLLSREEEQDLVAQLNETGDLDVAKKLVMANLRLVVKIAMEYRSAHKNVMDLIQEGNLGLMKAVSKYNPDKGAKLSYYSSWWIKSYILKFILDNFRLIKIGTTAEQKKLFYNLMREKEKLQNQGIEPSVKMISESLGVSEKSVTEMDHRLSSQGGEVSLDTPVGDGGASSVLSDFMESSEEAIDEKLAHQQDLKLLEEHLVGFVKDLKPRDQEIFKKRLLSEVPPSLQSIADGYGVSRERIRQIEARLLDKLKVYMSDFIG